MKKMKKAVTLVEIIVSAILLASVLAGIVATFVSTRRMVGKGAERVTAANAARQALDRLYPAVRADHMNIATQEYHVDDPLETGSHDVTPASAAGTVYDVDYEVSSEATGTYDYKVVDVTVKFTVPG